MKKQNKKKVVKKKVKKYPIINYEELHDIQVKIHNLLNKNKVSILGSKFVLQRMIDDANRRFRENPKVIGEFFDVDEEAVEEAKEKEEVRKVLKENPETKLKELFLPDGFLNLKKFKELVNAKK